MEKLNEPVNIDIEILKYAEGVEVSKEFKNKLESDKYLQKKVIEIKSDLYMMGKVKNSKMYKELQRKASIKIKSNIIEHIEGFILLTPVISRTSNTHTKIYHFQNVSIIIKDNIISLNIDKIEKSLIILKDNIETIKVSSLKEYSTNLERGNYTILLDDTTINIDIE